MPRGRFQLAYPVTLVVTLAVALLPAAVRLGWSRDAGELVKLIIVPASHPLRLLSSWMRPSPGPADRVDPEGMAAIIEERDLFEQMYRQLEARVEELEEENRELQNLPAETLRYASLRVFADVVLGNPNSLYGPLTLRLDRDAASRIVPGSIAVCDKVHLVGRTISEPGATCILQQIVDPSSKRICAKIVPQGDPTAAGLDIQLAATGAGTLEGHVEREDIVAEGDVVHVLDEDWPRTAQGMVVGLVESFHPDDREPLRKVIVVRPRVLASPRERVMIIVEAREGGSDDR